MEKTIIAETKNKGGRPKLQLNEEQIIALAKIHCTMEEIAAVMGCSISTLQRNFDMAIKKGKEQGKTSLRRYMWKAAEKGSVPMMIWLSKQILDMREPQAIEVVRENAKGVFNQWYDEIVKQ